MGIYLYAAVEAIYGFRDGYCETYCPHRKKREELIGVEHFNGPDRIKCYVCDQHFFVNILHKLIAGKEYSEIDDFQLYELSVKKKTNLNINIFPSVEDKDYQEHFKELLEGYLNRSSDYDLSIFSILEMENIKNHFAKSLQVIIGYSLKSFLVDDGRSKLHRCEKCQAFYVTKRDNLSRFCSDKCRMDWWNQKYIESGIAREYKKRKRDKEGLYQ